METYCDSDGHTVENHKLIDSLDSPSHQYDGQQVNIA